MKDRALLYHHTPMHEVTPKVVAMAVSTVMMMFRILLHRALFGVSIFDVLFVRNH